MGRIKGGPSGSPGAVTAREDAVAHLPSTGRRRKGGPTMTGHAGLGQDYGRVKKPTAGSLPYVAGYQIQDNTHTPAVNRGIANPALFCMRRVAIYIYVGPCHVLGAVSPAFIIIPAHSKREESVPPFYHSTVSPFGRFKVPTFSPSW